MARDRAKSKQLIAESIASLTETTRQLREHAAVLHRTGRDGLYFDVCCAAMYAQDALDKLKRAAFELENHP